jgi:YD repeat-containing protein
MNTGNVLQRWKPEQYAASGSGSGANPARAYPEYFTYDSRQLFVAHEKSEPVGYPTPNTRDVDYAYEYGTGAKLDTLGPNVSACSVQNPPTCVSGALTREEHKSTIDGFGRVLTRSETFSDDGNDYGTSLHATDIYAYTDSPQTVTHQAALYQDGAWNITYSQEVTDLDGLGRPFKKIVSTFGSAPADEITTYHWANDGTLTSIDVPDPASNDASVVTYHYAFDSLGRPVSMTRPDGGSPASGVTMSYDGLSQTTSEVVGVAGGLPASTTTTKDQFGRLATVDEQVSATGSVRTVYGYDGADRVNKITDPEGQMTSIGYDLAGRRTAITRGSRVWSYGYDRNGNMTSVTTPCTGTGCSALYTTWIAYDNADEPSSKLIAPRNLSSADIAYFGADHESFSLGLLRKPRRQSQGLGGHLVDVRARQRVQAPARLQPRRAGTRHREQPALR